MSCPTESCNVPAVNRGLQQVMHNGDVSRTIGEGNDAVTWKIGLDKRLKVHQGCVNCVVWNDSGEYVLSGSDDQKLVITNPFNGRVAARIASGHRRNIFQAKFLSLSGNTRVVSCAADGGIAYTQVDRPESYGKQIFHCNKKTVYQVVTPPADPNLFLSCAEDGSIRCYDLREQTSCNDDECKKDIILQLKDAVNGLDIDSFNPFYMATGSSDCLVRLFDRRMLQLNYLNDINKTCVKKFSVKTKSRNRDKMTYVKFDKFGDHILANTTPDRIIEFDCKNDETTFESCVLDQVPDESSNIPLDTGSNSQDNIKVRVRGDWSGTGPDSSPNDHQNRAQMTRTERLFMDMSTALTNILRNRARRVDEQDESEDNSDSSSNSPEQSRRMSDTSRGDLSLNHKNLAGACSTAEDAKEKVERGANVEEGADVDSKSYMKHVYTGHRNQRTIIKQCNYWGKNLIVSGSDCGHLFIWRRDTQKLVNVSVADRRVVNTVQPHPYYPLLASSGIDYDIKLWSPQMSKDDEDLVNLEDLIEQVTERNKEMLKTADNVMTLPARFVLPLMAMMARRQTDANQE